MASRATTVHDANVAGAATATKDVAVSGMESMLVIWRVSDSAATGDLSTTSVKTFLPGPAPGESDALVDVALPVTNLIAATGTAPTVKVDRYDIRGMDKVRLSLTNGAAGTKNLEMHVYLYG